MIILTSGNVIKLVTTYSIHRAPSRARGFRKSADMRASVLSAAIGTGVLAGATGVILYHYLYGKKNLLLLHHQISRLEFSLQELQQELIDLRNNIRFRGQRNHQNSSSASSIITTDASMYSAFGSTGSSEKDQDFCDISDNEELSGIQTPNKIDMATIEIDNKLNDSEFKEIDELLDGNDEQKENAYKTLMELNKLRKDDCNVLWRLAKACQRMAIIEDVKKNTKKKQEFINNGIEYGKKAIECDGKNADAHKWYAICVGERGSFVSTKEKIVDGFDFKDHIEQAISLNPQDPSLYHLLGRFEYEVSVMSSLERRVAGWLFAEVPKGSVTEALKLFEKTEELHLKPWKENKLFVAKCYIQMAKYDEAIQWLDEAAIIPAVTSEDVVLEEEIHKLIKKYSSYRKKT